MKKALFFFIFCAVTSWLFSQNIFIHVDQFGYYNNAIKVAVLSDPITGYNASENYMPSATMDIVDASTGQVVYSGVVDTWNIGLADAYSGDRGWQFDFSDFTTTGEYYLRDSGNGVQSPVFLINENPYLDVLKVAAKMFYYNRCNMEKVVPYAGEDWTDGNNFNNSLQDFNCRYIFDPNNAALEKDLSGGWFDAGDNNKYVTFTYPVIHNLLYAYQQNPDLFSDNWNIPESGNGLSDILDELKWELDWLKKMANPDGSVHIKMGNQNYAENVQSPPSANTDQRFYGPTCTSASAVMASVLAHAAYVFENIPGQESYAAEMEAIAIAAYDYVIPFFNADNLETDCDDGSIVAGDADMNPEEQTRALLSASVYLYALTGGNTYNQFLIDNAGSEEPLSTGFWGPYTLPLEDALVFYSSLSNANSTLANDIINSFSTEVGNNYNDYFGMNDLTLYRDFIPEWSYHWGSNKPKANYGSLNYLAAQYNVNNDSLSQRQKAEELLHSFHGVNPLGIVYLSNMYEYGADKSVNEIYHFWFDDQTDYDNAINSLYGPAPGFVSGGPNKDFTVTSISPPSGQPTTKSYLDWNTGFPENSWEISEPSISYQAAYIRLLSEIIGRGGFINGPTMSANVEVDENCINIYPNPTNDYFVIQGKLGMYDLEIINASGQVVRTISNVGVEQIVNINSLGPGMYLVRIERQGNSQLFFQNIIKQ